MLLLTAALLIWPCPAAPALEEPEIRPITKAAGARLEIDAVLELPPPPATQRSCSGYRSKCRSQSMIKVQQQREAYLVRDPKWSMVAGAAARTRVVNHDRRWGCGDSTGPGLSP